MLLCLLTLLYCLAVKSDSLYWPAGSYGIPKATFGCPDADGFQWLIGWRYQDTEDNNPNNNKSQEFHLDGKVDKTHVTRYFCMKTDTSTDVNRNPWPRGQYCIYKKGGTCPTNLTSGFIKWDDEDNDNHNKNEGTLPDGEYDDRDTKIEFCCRMDGNTNDPISLPSLKPFFLLAYNSTECQQVKWAVANVEWIRFHSEDSDNKDEKGGSYPYGAGINSHTIHYCYYRGCNQTLTSVNGTFHSPNYPREYPDGQYCSWRITVSPAQLVHVTFTNFSLQTENNTDSVYVYDGNNATGEVLGVFYGGHPPPQEGIYSLSNHMFLIFKSDKTGSYTGFSAMYNAVYCSACKSTTNVATSVSHSPFSTGTDMATSSYNEQEMTTFYTEPEMTTSYAKPEITTFRPKLEMTTSYIESKMTTSHKEPEISTSCTEAEITTFHTELEMTTSYAELEMTTSHTEQEVTKSYVKPEMTTSHTELEVTKSFVKPEVTTFHTEPETTKSNKEQTPTADGASKGGGQLDGRKQHRNKGVNVTAVVVPVLLIALFALMLICGFFFHKRMKAKEQSKIPYETIYLRRFSADELHMSFENPACYNSEEENNVDNTIDLNKLAPEREHDKRCNWYWESTV